MMEEKSKQRKGRAVTVMELNKAKAGQTIACGYGLILEITPAGSKKFRIRYKIGEKAKKYTLGDFGNLKGQLTLEEARKQAIELKQKINDGINLSSIRRIEKLDKTTDIGTTVESVAAEWYDNHGTNQRTERTNSSNRSRVFNHAMPAIGFMPISEIQTRHLYTVFEKLKDKKNTAEKIKQDLDMIFDYALRYNKIDINPVAGVKLRTVLKKQESKPMPHLRAEELPEFFKALYAANPNYLFLQALHAGALTGLRPSEVRFLKWEYLDAKNNRFNLPKELMKVPREQKVHISKQLAKVLDKVRELNLYSKDGYIFAAKTKDGVISENAPINPIHNAGYKGKMSAHGWRHILSTIANQSQQFSADCIELQLHHDSKDGNKIRATYDFSDLMPERIKLLDWYGDKLEELGARF